MDEQDNSLSSLEWQLLLVLRRLQYDLSEEENNKKLIEWIEEKIKDLDARSGW